MRSFPGNLHRPRALWLARKPRHTAGYVCVLLVSQSITISAHFMGAAAHRSKWEVKGIDGGNLECSCKARHLAAFQSDQ
jgi:hypothetical protein